jgi:hypothetical protein
MINIYISMILYHFVLEYKWNHSLNRSSLAKQDTIYDLIPFCAQVQVESFFEPIKFSKAGHNWHVEYKTHSHS